MGLLKFIIVNFYFLINRYRPTDHIISSHQLAKRVE